MIFDNSSASALIDLIGSSKSSIMAEQNVQSEIIAKYTEALRSVSNGSFLLSVTPLLLPLSLLYPVLLPVLPLSPPIAEAVPKGILPEMKNSKSKRERA